MADSATDFIMQRISRYPVLSHERQLLLARQVRTWFDWSSDDGPCPPSIEKRGRRAKDRLIETNMRLVVSQATRFRHLWQQNPDRLNDLIQEGAIGLNRAIEKFDPARGYSFSTYAISWIRQGVSRKAGAAFDTIRWPEHIHWQHSKLSKLISTFEAEHGYRPTAQWLADASGLTIEKVHATIVIGSVRVTKSLDQLPHGGDGTSIGDLIPDNRCSDPDEILDRELRLELLDQLLQQLPDQDRILMRRLHIDRATYKEAGAELGVSRSRIGQRATEILERLRQQAGGATFDHVDPVPCIQCGEQFIPVLSSRQQLCSTTCRSQRRRELHVARQLIAA